MTLYRSTKCSAEEHNIIGLCEAMWHVIFVKEPVVGKLSRVIANYVDKLLLKTYGVDDQSG